MKKITLTKSTMKKITLTAAVATALLFALAAGTAGVPTVHGQSDGSPSKYVAGHHASLSPVGDDCPNATVRGRWKRA